MGQLMELNDGVAGNRVVPFRAFLSNGTAPDTGLSNDSIRMSINGAAQITPNALISAISAAAGMYSVTLVQSNLSVLGSHALWYDQGDFAQHVATVQVVNFNPFSSFSNIAAKAYSGVTVGAGDYAAKDMTSALTVGAGIATPSKFSVRLELLDYSSAVTVGAGIATPSKFSVRLEALDYSSVVTVGAGIATPSKVTVQIQGGVYSNVSLRLDATAIPAGAFQADSIDATALAAMNLSDVTVRVQPMLYSGLTVGVNNITPATYSGVTVESLPVGLTAAAIDAVWDDAVAEPAGVFAWASATPRKILTWLGALSTNSLSQSSVLQTLRTRADDASISTAPASSSSTLFVRGTFT